MKHYSVKIRSEFVKEERFLTVNVENYYEFLRWLEILRIFQTSNILSVSYNEIGKITKSKRV